MATLRRAVQALQRSLGRELRSGWQRNFRCADDAICKGASGLGAAPPMTHAPALRCSEGQAVAGSTKPNPFNVDSEAASKIFENVRLPEAEAAGAAAAEAEADALESTAAGRVLSAVGNALFLGGVAAASFFGYYTYRYEADQVEHMVEETKKPDNAFPGSSVSSLSRAAAGVSRGLTD